MQGESSFSIRINRFTTPVTIQKSYNCIQLKKNLKSINEPTENFTNFSKSMATNKYKIVKNIYKQFVNNENIIDKNFQADELLNDRYKIERLKRIIYKNIGKMLTTPEVLNNVHKFKNVNDKEIQFYFFYDGKILNLILIDLYHLGIPAKKNGRDVFKQNYLNNKKNKCNLSTIITN